MYILRSFIHIVLILMEITNQDKISLQFLILLNEL